MLVLEVVLT